MILTPFFSLFYQTCRHHHRLLSVFSEHNKETSDTAVSPEWISHPERGWRLKTFPRSAQRNRALSKNRSPHFTASESQPLKQKRQQVFSTYYPWERPSWHPFNMGSPLPELRPQPLGAPDTPLPRLAASTLTAAIRWTVSGWLKGWRGWPQWKSEGVEGLGVAVKNNIPKDKTKSGPAVVRLKNTVNAN